jgi:hypothetical protein
VSLTIVFRETVRNLARIRREDKDLFARTRRTASLAASTAGVDVDAEGAQVVVPGQCHQHGGGPAVFAEMGAARRLLPETQANAAAAVIASHSLRQQHN